MKVGPAKYTQAGDIEFAAYSNGHTAIMIMAESGDRECVATVNLDGLGAPEPGCDQVWIKTWSENQGIEAALVSSGVVTLTGKRFNCGPYDAVAVLGDLTPAAIAERKQQRGV